MTAGTLRHNRIAINALLLLGDRFDGLPCQVFINDVKLHVQAADSVYYPDVFVHCGAAVAGGDKLVHDALLIVKVSGDTTAQIDRREKLAAYQKLPGLRAYWIVAQAERRVELHRRSASGLWTAEVLTAGDSLPVEDGPAILLDRLYAGTDVEG